MHTDLRCFLTAPILIRYNIIVVFTYHAHFRYQVRPRHVRDTSDHDTKLTLLGEEIDFPVCVSPSGVQCCLHWEGEKATARGAVFNLMHAPSLHVVHNGITLGLPKTLISTTPLQLAQK